MDAQRPKVLVVDDAPFVRAVLERVLGAGGYAVHAVADGRAALAAAAEPYDLVLADIHLPDLDGPDLISLLRTGRGPNRTTPVVLLSGDVPDDADLVGAAAFLSKPIAPAALLAALAQVGVTPPPN